MMKWVSLRKQREPSPLGHIALRTAVLAASTRSGSSWDAVTPARTSHADAKSSNANSIISVSTCAFSPASASCARNGAGSPSAPGPTPGTGGSGAKLPAACWSNTISARGGCAVDHIHQAERCQDRIEALRVRGYRLCTAFDKSNVRPSRGSAPPGNCQHVRADIESRNASVRRDGPPPPRGARAGPRAKVEHVLARLEISTFYDTLDNKLKALIDLASVDRYHPIPDADLPRQPFGVLPLIHLGLLSSCLSEGQIPPATLREGTGPEPQETFAEDSPSPQMVEMGICLNKSKRKHFCCW